MNLIRLAFVLLQLMIITPALGGPGTAGGNPRTMLLGLKQGYMLLSPYPINQVFTENSDYFEFALDGYRMQVQRLAAPQKNCPYKATSKEVCRYETENGTQLIFVFSPMLVYKVELENRGLSSVDWEEVISIVRYSFNFL